MCDKCDLTICPPDAWEKPDEDRIREAFEKVCGYDGIIWSEEKDLYDFVSNKHTEAWLKHINSVYEGFEICYKSVLSESEKEIEELKKTRLEDVSYISALQKEYEKLNSLLDKAVEGLEKITHRSVGISQAEIDIHNIGVETLKEIQEGR